jgi:hypothetical protein
MSFFVRPLSCGVCSRKVYGPAQWTMRGWIHPACAAGLPEIPAPWYCPVCERWTSVPLEHHVGAPVHLGALADSTESVPEPVPGQLVFGGVR